MHPFEDDEFIAGNATAGLEILEDLPDVDAVVAGFGGGGLSCGIAAALKERGSKARSSQPNPRRPLRSPILSRKARRNIFRTGRQVSSTAAEANRSSRACGTSRIIF